MDVLSQEEINALLNGGGSGNSAPAAAPASSAVAGSDEKLRDDVLNQFKTHKEYKEYYQNKKSR